MISGFNNGAEVQINNGDDCETKHGKRTAPGAGDFRESADRIGFSSGGTCISGDDTVPQGIYDLTLDMSDEGGYGYSSVTLLYPDGESKYFWVDGPDYAVTSSRYTDISVRNIVIPEGTEITVEYGGVVLEPSEGYYDADYSVYEGK